MSSFASGHASHVTSNTSSDEPHEMTPDLRPKSASDQASICPTDTDNLIPKGPNDTDARVPVKQPKQRQDFAKWSSEWVEYHAKTFTAGGIAACAAKTVVAPLDRVKILFQANNPQFQKYTGTWSGAAKAIRDIYRTNGPTGLFRGHSATLLRIYPYGGIKFAVYEPIRRALIRSPEQETSMRRFAAGALAGTASVMMTYPLEVIRVRMAWETKQTKRMSYRDIVGVIYNERPRVAEGGMQGTNLPKPAVAAVEATQAVARAAATAKPTRGMANFYRGFTPTMWGMVPYAGASFLTHDAAGDFMRLPFLRKWTLDRPQDQAAAGKAPKLVWWAELMTGGFAGFVSQTVSYPLEVIRRRMQVGGVVGDGHRLTMIEVFRNIRAEKGLQGFFVGLGIGYVKVVPMVATSFFVYDRMKRVFGI